MCEIQSAKPGPVPKLPHCPSCDQLMQLVGGPKGSANCRSCLPLNADRAAYRMSQRHDGDRTDNACRGRSCHERRLAWARPLVLRGC